MKPTLLSTMAAVLGLVVITAGQAWADAPIKINISGTTYIQGDPSPIYTSTISKARFNTKDLLNVFADALNLSQPFPKGATVEVGSDLRVTVNFQGQELANVTSYFVITVDEEEAAELDQVKFNEKTGQQTSTHMYPISFQIGDDDGSLDNSGADDGIPEVELYLSGIAFESFKAGAVQEGIQSVGVNIKANVSGTGTVDSKPAIFVGTITAKGKGYEQVD